MRHIHHQFSLFIGVLISFFGMAQAGFAKVDLQMGLKSEWAADPSSGHSNGQGVLILAHGVASHSGDTGHGHAGGHHHAPAEEGPWEFTVRALVSKASERISVPVALAFGMWNRESFQRGVDELVARGVTHLKVVPLFVSSHSLVIRAQHYMFGLSERNPLPWMDPGKLVIPEQIESLQFTQALDDSVEVSGILERRVESLSEDSESEEVILVAHGPVTEEDNVKWLADLSAHASRMKGSRMVHVLTLRDDAPAEIRDQATRELREKVMDVKKNGRIALIVPVLLAPGGIEKGLLERLDGLSYRYKGEMLAGTEHAPEQALVDWLVRMAKD